MAQRHRHTVERFEAVGFWILLMLMQINEAGCANHPVRIDCPRPRKRCCSNPLDCVAPNPNVAHRIQTGLGIRHTAGFQHKVERF